MDSHDIEELKKKVAALTARAKNHGVDLLPGETIVIIVSKLLDRLDAYRDKPQNKGRILIE